MDMHVKRVAYDNFIVYSYSLPDTYFATQFQLSVSMGGADCHYYVCCCLW